MTTLTVNNVKPLYRLTPKSQQFLKRECRAVKSINAIQTDEHTLCQTMQALLRKTITRCDVALIAGSHSNINIFLKSPHDVGMPLSVHSSALNGRISTGGV